MGQPRDILVCVPKDGWRWWCQEGDHPGSSWSGEYSHFTVPFLPRDIAPGVRIYVASWGHLRGYAPLVTIEQPCQLGATACLVRGGGAVACTIARPLPGFRGWRYVDWDRADERPFPSWRTAFVGYGKTWCMSCGEECTGGSALCRPCYEEGRVLC